MWNGKKKAVTFSFDDGVTQDIRLVEILNKYGLKGTFNLNSGRLGCKGALERNGRIVSHDKVQPNQVRSLYAGHEIAVHTLTHPALSQLSDEEVIRQVEEDRVALSELAGYEVVGMAYPGGTHVMNEHVADLIRENTGVKYARTTTSTHNFDLQTNLHIFNPTVYHHVEWDKLFALGEQFINLQPDKPQIYYIWGHAYEFDIHGDWERFEEFCRLISGKNDIFYGTNRQVLLNEV
jgi:hypothetical protein